MIRVAQQLELLSPPEINSAVRAFVWSQWLRFRYSFLASFVSTTVEPALTFLIIGFGLGRLIPEINSVSYAEYILPGVAAVFTMTVAYLEVGYGVLRRINQKNYYHVILQAPLRPQDIVLGEITWGAIKGTGAGLSVIITGALLGLVASWQASLSLAFLLLSGLFFSAVGVLVAVRRRSANALSSLHVLWLVPMSLMSNTLFPVAELGRYWTWLPPLFPLAYSVQATREFIAGDLSEQIFLSLAVLILLSTITMNLAIRQFVERIEGQ